MDALRAARLKFRRRLGSLDLGDGEDMLVAEVERKASDAFAQMPSGMQRELSMLAAGGVHDPGVRFDWSSVDLSRGDAQSTIRYLEALQDYCAVMANLHKDRGRFEPATWYRDVVMSLVTLRRRAQAILDRRVATTSWARHRYR